MKKVHQCGKARHTATTSVILGLVPRVYVPGKKSYYIQLVVVMMAGPRDKPEDDGNRGALLAPV